MAMAYFNLSRRQAYKRVQEDEARLREIATTMRDGLLVADTEGKINFANPEACRLLGYREEELIGADMHGTLHAHGDGEVLERDECRMLRVMQTREPYRGAEETFKRKDGQFLPISVSVSAIVRGQRAGGIVVVFHDITDRKKYQQELEHRARTDALTGLNNRRHFHELAELEVARAKRYGKSLSVMMLDLDHFKDINDAYGHQVGDTVLQKFSNICLQSMREIDVIGRLGGEEFAILLPEANITQAMEAAERLRAEVEHTALPLEGGQVITFRVSIGVTELHEADQDIASLLKRADAAMYDAKQAGRNSVCMRK
jgi:diguanylate cyclase (GGDEF)-like protein/PAS domain S-box-containing protein